VKVYHQAQALPSCPRYVAIGTFDGMHVGHQRIIKQLVTEATDDGALSTVVTFHPHPRSVLAARGPKLLTSLDTRLRIMEALRVDSALVVPFDREFAKCSAEDFVREFLVRDLAAKKAFVGFNFRFGHGGVADVTTLRQLGDVAGLDVCACAPVRVRGQVVSSSQVRRLVRTGEVAKATTLLGRPYRLSGPVEHGDGRGRLLGFPTANVRIPAECLWPGAGVYAVHASYLDEETWHGPHLSVANIGRQPTFADDGQRSLRLEVHVIGVAVDLYGREVAVDFLDRIRDEKRFSDMDALSAQLQQDVAQAVEQFRADSLM